MSESATTQLVVAAMLMGVMAAWLFGVWLHLKLVRRSRAAARRVVRMVLPMEINTTLSFLVQALNRSPHFFTTVKGHLEGVLVASIRSSLSGAPSANMACRLDDLGQESRVRLRLDFTPMIDRTRAQSRLWLLMLWPAWIAVTIGVIASVYGLATAEISPWFAINLVNAAWPPLIVVVLLHLRFRKRRKVLGDSIIAVVESLRFLPRG